MSSPRKKRTTDPRKLIAKPKIEHDMILPRILLIGCRPLVPYHGQADPPFHSPPLSPVDVGDYQWPPEQCPTCRGKIGLRKRPAGFDARDITLAGLDAKVEYCTDEADPQHPESLDHLTFCLWCYGTNLRNAARISRLLSLERQRRIASDRSARSRNQINNALARRLRGSATLTESERRRIYCGYKGGIDRDFAHLIHGSLSKIGRAWLAGIDQLPDFTTILDGTGKPVGHWQENESGEWVAVYDRPYDLDEPPHRRFLNFPPVSEAITA